MTIGDGWGIDGLVNRKLHEKLSSLLITTNGFIAPVRPFN